MDNEPLLRATRASSYGTFEGLKDTSFKKSTIPPNGSSNVATTLFGEKHLRWIPSERNDSFSSSLRPITSQPPSLPPVLVEKDFLLPIKWDQPSVLEAHNYYHQKQQSTPPSLDIHDRYSEISSLLYKHFCNQHCLKDATNKKQGDARKYYLMADRKYCYAVETLKKEYTPISIDSAKIDQKIAHYFRFAASIFQEVIELTKPNSLTGPLTIKTRENGLTAQYELSKFSFKEEGSIDLYYQLITSNQITEGSNFETIKHQKRLIESAYLSLAKAHAKIHQTEFRQHGETIFNSFF